MTRQKTSHKKVSAFILFKGLGGDSGSGREWKGQGESRFLKIFNLSKLAIIVMFVSFSFRYPGVARRGEKEPTGEVTDLQAE